MSKIALGSAQFGMDYGINNQRGKIPKEEVFDILNFALESGIDTIDTAYDYEESESVIGEFIKSRNKKFKIISKLPKCSAEEVNAIVYSSLKNLGISSFYGYLIHNFDSFMKEPACLAELNKLKNKEIIKKIGFSIYYLEELDYILKNNIRVDIIQLPYSIFDQRFADYIVKLKKMRVEVHVRSVFLQGLLLKKAVKLDRYFYPVKDKLSKLQLFAKELSVPLAALMVNFAVLNDFIDKVIVGIDNLENFIEIIDSKRFINEVYTKMDQLYNFKEENENILLPFKWKEVINK